MRDSDDRHVIFHGVNVVYKVDPYLPNTQPESAIIDSQNSLDDADIDNLVKWGFNFVRLGVMWEGVETADGVYNEKYLKDVNDLVTRLGEKGIYTLIDSHQDAVTRLIHLPQVHLLFLFKLRALLLSSFLCILTSRTVAP